MEGHDLFGLQSAMRPEMGRRTSLSALRNHFTHNVVGLKHA